MALPTKLRFAFLLLLVCLSVTTCMNSGGVPAGSAAQRELCSADLQPAPRRVETNEAEAFLFPEALGIRLILPGDFRTKTKEQILRLSSLKGFNAHSGGGAVLPESAGRGPLQLHFQYVTREYLLSELPSGLSEDQLRQSYVLATDSGGVTIRADHPTGFVYGTVTALELIRRHNGHLLIPSCRILDWPEYSARYVSEYSVPSGHFLDWLVSRKINGFATSYRALDWSGLSPATVREVARIGRYVVDYETIRHLAQLHLGGRGGPVMDTADPVHQAQLLQTIDTLVGKGGAGHIMLCYDDVVPLLEQVESRLYLTPAAAHVALLDFVRQYLDQKHPDVRLSFVPPYYRTAQFRSATEEESAREYAAVLRTWPDEVTPIVWTGPQTVSTKISTEDVEKFQAIVGSHHPLIYWGNTWHELQPLPVFRSEYPVDFSQSSEWGFALMYVNAVDPRGRLFSLTGGSYYWNPRAFDWREASEDAIADMASPAATEAAHQFYELKDQAGWRSMLMFNRNQRLWNTLIEFASAAPDAALSAQALAHGW